MPNVVQPERKRRDDLDRKWDKYVDELVPDGKWAPGWTWLRRMRPFRQDGDTFIVDYDYYRLTLDWLKLKVPELYAELSDRCRMVRRGDAEPTGA